MLSFFWKHTLHWNTEILPVFGCTSSIYILRSRPAPFETHYAIFGQQRGANGSAKPELLSKQNDSAQKTEYFGSCPVCQVRRGLSPADEYVHCGYWRSYYALKKSWFIEPSRFEKQEGGLSATLMCPVILLHIKALLRLILRQPCRLSWETL